MSLQYRACRRKAKMVFKDRCQKYEMKFDRFQKEKRKTLRPEKICIVTLQETFVFDAWRKFILVFLFIVVLHSERLPIAQELNSQKGKRPLILIKELRHTFVSHFMMNGGDWLLWRIWFFINFWADLVKMLFKNDA